MMSSQSPELLQRLLTRGVPAPLASLSSGSAAILAADHTITVFDSVGSQWTLQATARWLASSTSITHPWAVLAPHPSGLALLNMATCDVSALPEAVRMSLDMQRHRHAHAASAPEGRFRVLLHSHEAHITAPAGAVRVVPIGTPYTVTAEAYRRHEEVTFSFLSPSLRVAARTIAQFGPLSTEELLHRVYPTPSANNKAALNMTLTRLRKHPRVVLSRGEDGRLTVAAQCLGNQPAAASG